MTPSPGFVCALGGGLRAAGAVACRSMVQSWEWPLSREDKKRRIFYLYERELALLRQQQCSRLHCTPAPVEELVPKLLDAYPFVDSARVAGPQSGSAAIRNKLQTVAKVLATRSPNRLAEEVDEEMPEATAPLTRESCMVSTKADEEMPEATTPLMREPGIVSAKADEDLPPAKVLRELESVEAIRSWGVAVNALEPEMFDSKGRSELYELRNMWPNMWRADAEEVQPRCCNTRYDSRPILVTAPHSIPVLRDGHSPHNPQLHTAEIASAFASVLGGTSLQWTGPQQRSNEEDAHARFSGAWLPGTGRYTQSQQAVLFGGFTHSVQLGMSKVLRRELAWDSWAASRLSNAVHAAWSKAKAKSASETEEE